MSETDALLPVTTTTRERARAARGGGRRVHISKFLYIVSRNQSLCIIQGQLETWIDPAQKSRLAGIPSVLQVLAPSPPRDKKIASSRRKPQ